MKKPMRKELVIGMLFFGISMAAGQFFALPEFLRGLLLGFALCFELIGILPEPLYQKIKAFKSQLFKRQLYTTPQRLAGLDKPCGGVLE